MRGFLRRTLENARGGEQRLRPLTGSVYAVNHRRPDFHSESWREETVNIPVALSTVPPSREVVQPEVPRATSTAAPTPLLPVTPVPREAAAGGNESNGSRASSFAESPHRESATGHARHTGASHPPFSSFTSLGQVHFQLPSNSQRNEGSPPAASVRQRPQEISRADKVQQPGKPLVTAAAPLQKLAPSLRPVMPIMPPRAAPQLSPARNLPPQEPDIQVHIGRIEVIAAAPQMPRVASPKPSRATSLADYLAAGNGRSR